MRYQVLALTLLLLGGCGVSFEGSRNLYDLDGAETLSDLEMDQEHLYRMLADMQSWIIAQYPEHSNEQEIRVPKVKFVPLSELQNATFMARGVVRHGTYRTHSGGVVLVNAKLPFNPRALSLIFHEVVHHVQFKTGQVTSSTCISVFERQAYILQDRWLRERGQRGFVIPDLSYLINEDGSCIIYGG